MANDWRFNAACKDEDPELFFVVGDEKSPGNQLQIASSKYVCSHCPVRSDCLAFAFDNGLDHGVFGGLTRDERRKLKNRTPAPVEQVA